MPFSQLPENIVTLEKNKFELDSNNEVAVRTTTEITAGNVNATPSGLSVAFKITTMDVTNTAALIPGTPLASRNSISIFNKSETETIYIGPDSSVTADSVNGITSGWEIQPLGTLNLDARDTIAIYAIANNTVKVKVLEIA